MLIDRLAGSQLSDHGRVACTQRQLYYSRIRNTSFDAWSCR